MNYRKKIFTEIFQNNIWESDESISGPGSTLQYTFSVRQNLLNIIKEFNIKSIFDAACGDFNWMKHVINKTEINYFGMDIVPELIEQNNKKYCSKNIIFQEGDIVIEKYPQSDLMICRDVFIHLNNQDNLKIIQNFIDSNIKYLLISSFTDQSLVNYDLNYSDIENDIYFRQVNLFKFPYNFSKIPIYRFSDWKTFWKQKEMCLWCRQQLIDQL